MISLRKQTADEQNSLKLKKVKRVETQHPIQLKEDKDIILDRMSLKQVGFVKRVNEMFMSADATRNHALP